MYKCVALEITLPAFVPHVPMITPFKTFLEFYNQQRPV